MSDTSDFVESCSEYAVWWESTATSVDVAKFISRFNSTENFRGKIPENQTNF